MNLEGFIPTPVVGNHYKKADGTKITIIAIGYVDGHLYVLYEENGEKLSVYQDGWNDMHLTEVGGSVPPPPENHDSAGSKQDAESENSKKTYNEDVNDFISKVGSVEKLMNRKPVFQAEYYPTDQFSDISDNEMEESDVVQSLQKTLDEIDGLRIDRKCNGIYEFLWWCAGVDRRLIRSCPTDWSKKAGLGGVILGTGLLATLSGGYAMYTVFDSRFAAVVIGLFWGLIIFNFDRYLVNSMVSDGTAKITKDEFYSALPQIIIAIFLGIVISVPIEIKLFDGNVNEVIESEKTKFLKKREKDALATFEEESKRHKDNYDKALQDLDVIKNCLKWEEAGYYYDRATGEVLKDEKGNGIKSRQGAGNGGVYNSLKEDEKSLINKVDTLERKYNMYLQSVNKDEIISTARKEAEKDFKKQIGLIKKYEILQSLTKFYSDEPSEEKPWWKFWAREINGMFWVKLVITLLFIVLEIMPVFAKMMQEDGWYEKWIDREDKTRQLLAIAKECNHQNVCKEAEYNR